MAEVTLDEEVKAKKLYEAGIKHYNNISNQIPNQSDISMYTLGFLRSMFNDEKMKNEYLSIILEETTAHLMKRIR